ncbi:hypothetical protein [Streptomyces sp. NPDC052012]|uniref:hypothetical protein n=1 Tax=Streptomyces sp. NPDC052012 TaxID=3155051 RepID=UPI00344CCA37
MMYERYDDCTYPDRHAQLRVMEGRVDRERPHQGAGGSGPRDREAFLFEEGRALLWWYVEEVRGEFPDDPCEPRAPLFFSS